MDGHEQLLGQVIDEKYRVDRLVGNGGMGSVYAGLHLQLSRPVAIKILKTDLHADEMMHARFIREARAAARIEHPNAIRVYDFGSVDGLGSFIVMEFAEGVSLREFLVQQGRLSLNLALDLIQQAAAALTSAHASGVIHRDVKPENFMVCFGADGRPILKVVDFGIAKVVTSDGSTQLTRPTDIIGTPRYMAPEQFTGEEIDSRIDVYALGIVLFEMLTGRAPFEGTFSEIIGKHIYAEPPRLAAIGVEVPDEIEFVLRRALAKSPDDRPQTAFALAEEFAEACGPEISGTVPQPFSVILRSPVGTSGSLEDPSEAPTSAGTHVAGSPERPSAPLAPQAYVTNLAVGIPADEMTQVRSISRFLRRRPSARIVVPLGEEATSSIGRARVTARELLTPMLRTRWAAPAAIALAGCITFGTFALQGSGEAGTAMPLPAAVAPAAIPAPTAMVEPPKATETAAESDASVERSSKQADHHKANGATKKQPDTALRKVGRALRVDRHLRRIF